MFKELGKTVRLFKRSYSPHVPNTSILCVAGLTAQYKSGCALDNISFELHKAERIAIIGPNGAGKSTLLKIIAGVLKPTSGYVQIYGGDPDSHGCIAYVPQRSHVDWHYPVTISDVVMMGRIGKIGLLRHPSAHDRHIVAQALETVNLLQLAHRQINELSGGQQQRMFIARALAQEAELMLMDEPLTGLDIASQEDLFRILDQLRQRQVTVLIALHDLKLAANYFDRVLLLNRRLVGFGLPTDVFSPQRLLTAYGGHLHLTMNDDGILAIGDTCCDYGESSNV